MFGSARSRRSSVAASGSWDCADRGIRRQWHDGGAGRKTGAGLQQSTTRRRRLKVCAHPSLPLFVLTSGALSNLAELDPRDLLQIMSITSEGVVRGGA